MRILIAGCGVVGQAFLRLIDENRAGLYARHGFAPRVVGIADSAGAALCDKGLDIPALLRAKESEGSVAAIAEHGHAGVAAERMISEVQADVLVEATPSSLGEPDTAIQHLKAAFGHGAHVVTVNKVPLAVALPALRELAEHNRVLFRFSGTVGAGTPILALAAQCARGDEIRGVRAILNGTTNFILWRMGQAADSFDDALAEAVRLGYAETDPSADIDGIDTAIKVVIFANVILGRAVTLSDVEIEGIRGLPATRISEAAKQGKRVKLLGEIGDQLRVFPGEVDAHGPLDVSANLNAISLSLRQAGDVTLIGRGAGGVETATAVLRDLLDIWHTIGERS